MIKKLNKENTKGKENLKGNVKGNKLTDVDLSYIKDDKILKKVEKYVDETREKTSKDIIERKNKRPVRKYQEGDLEVMISKIFTQSQQKKETKGNNKWIVYTIYLIITVGILILASKYFFVGKLPQIS